MTTEPAARSSPVLLPPEDSDSDSDSTPTNSSDEFDWEAEEEDSPQATELKKAKRIRRLWLLYSRLSRGVRLLLFGGLGTAIILAPYIVFELRFKSNVVYKQVAAWSIWLAISFAAVRFEQLSPTIFAELVNLQSIMTAIVVGVIPRFIIWIMFAIWGKAPESVKVGRFSCAG